MGTGSELLQMPNPRKNAAGSVPVPFFGSSGSCVRDLGGDVRFQNKGEGRVFRRKARPFPLTSPPLCSENALFVTGFAAPSTQDPDEPLFPRDPRLPACSDRIHAVEVIQPTCNIYRGTDSSIYLQIGRTMAGWETWKPALRCFFLNGP